MKIGQKNGYTIWEPTSGRKALQTRGIQVRSPQGVIMGNKQFRFGIADDASRTAAIENAKKYAATLPKPEAGPTGE